MDTRRLTSDSAAETSHAFAAQSVAGNASQSQTAVRVPDHELISRIGQGSYGEVWLARNVMGTYRAVKIVYRSTFEHTRPFEREFNGIQKFEPISRSHDGLVDVLQVGRTDTYFYYVMELADDQTTGQQVQPDRYIPKTLRSELTQRGKLPPDVCLEIALSLTSSLGHMHQKGLIHRDIKPSNIIFVNGLPKLADIGLVAEQNEAKSFVGTEGFIPPEGPGTPQADIYSLGKVLYEICTGKDRHEFPALPTLLDAQPGQATSLLELNAVFLKACHSDVKHRYENAAEMQHELLLLQSGRSVKRWRTIERRLDALGKIALVGASMTILILIAFLYARRQAQVQSNLRRQAEQQLYVSDMSVAERALAEGNIRRVDEILDEYDRSGARELRGFEYHYLRQQCAGEQRWTLPVQTSKVFAVAYSPDGKMLLTGSSYLEEKDWSGELKLFDVDSRTELRNVPLRTRDGVRAVAFSNDGKLFASESQLDN